MLNKCWQCAKVELNKLGVATQTLCDGCKAKRTCKHGKFGCCDVCGQAVRVEKKVK